MSETNNSSNPPKMRSESAIVDETVTGDDELEIDTIPAPPSDKEVPMEHGPSNEVDMAIFRTLLKTEEVTGDANGFFKSYETINVRKSDEPGIVICEYLQPIMQNETVIAVRRNIFYVDEETGIEDEKRTVHDIQYLDVGPIDYPAIIKRHPAMQWRDIFEMKMGIARLKHKE